jgi:hypothetical protein
MIKIHFLLFTIKENYLKSAKAAISNENNYLGQIYLFINSKQTFKTSKRNKFLIYLNEKRD